MRKVTQIILVMLIGIMLIATPVTGGWVNKARNGSFTSGSGTNAYEWTESNADRVYDGNYYMWIFAGEGPSYRIYQYYSTPIELDDFYYLNFQLKTGYTVDSVDVDMWIDTNSCGDWLFPIDTLWSTSSNTWQSKTVTQETIEDVIEYYCGSYSGGAEIKAVWLEQNYDYITGWIAIDSVYMWVEGGGGGE